MIPKEKIEQLAEERFGFNSATENYKGWVNGFECGVSFAETELQQSIIFEIDFAGHCKAKIEFKDGKLNVVAAMDGFGDAIDLDEITITQIEQ